MLKIRLQRIGKKHEPRYRLVLVDSRRSTKSGSFLEVLGFYDAPKGQAQFKNERIKELLSKGAQASDTAHNFFIKSGIIPGKKIDVLHHAKIKTKLEKEKPKEEKRETPVS